MNLKTKYMGLELKNPLVASAGPLSDSVENIKKLEAAGGSAVVMFSLFEEQLKAEANALDAQLAAGTDSSSIWAWSMYVGAMVAAVFLFAYRIVLSVDGRRKRQAGGPHHPQAKCVCVVARKVLYSVGE